MSNGNKSKTSKAENKILSKQEKYKKLREKARIELKVLEDYFGKGKLDDLTVYTEIKKHLEASQKEISYFGLRGIVIGLITTIFVYLFNTQMNQNIGQVNVGNWLSSYIINQIVAIIVVLVFLCIYFITTSDFFISDWSRRNQIYINEYILKLVEEKIVAINDNKKG